MHAMLRALSIVAALMTPLPAAAMVGGAGAAQPELARAVVMIVGARGFCSGVALARDLVLTAAHCVPPGADYKILEYDAAKQPQLRDVKTITIHPQFDSKAMAAHRATADVALVKLATPLASVAPLSLGGPDFTVAAGDSFLIAGSGVTARGDGRSGGTVRAAQLVATGRPGTLQIRLHDPATRGEKAGLGACTGDSGGPVFRMENGALAIVGVVSWTTAPRNEDGCGGLTGVTPLTLYRAWITRSAKILGNQI